MKMITIPMPFSDVYSDSASNNFIIRFFSNNSYYTDKMYISSECFKEIEVAYSCLNVETDDEYPCYRVTIYFNRGSDLTISEKISYHFPNSKTGVETAHKLVNSIISKINS